MRTLGEIAYAHRELETAESCYTELIRKTSTSLTRSPLDIGMLGQVFVTQGEADKALKPSIFDRLAGQKLSGDQANRVEQHTLALKRAQREGQEIKNAVLRGEYASISLLAEVLATASQSVVERFDQLPAALRKTCPDLPEAARDQVMALLANARNEWVRATADLVAKNLAPADEADFEPGDDE
jgi:hypothetical protein